MFRHVIIGAVAAFGLANAANATVEISTTARGVFSNVRVVGQSAFLVGPNAIVTGRTSPGYSLNNSVPSLAAIVGLGNQNLVTATLSLNSGAIATAASANGTTPANTTSGSASSEINNLAISLFTIGGAIPNVLSLTADQVQSVTTVTKAGLVTTNTGQSLFDNLALSINGSNVFSTGSNAQTAVNFVAYDQGGLKVTLNQQFASNFGDTRTLITNAIGISFSNYLLDGRSLSGTITVGQSLSEFIDSAGDPVPEPAGWAQMLAGFAMAGSAARRKRRRHRRA
ncbi:PEP-CTERM domain protein [Sandarakinorhabdus sp. AAP62]|uniref:PEP-CTERM domain protein n=1 Tax=Sandarakinorhabdus sp. AAP62 TaxID=1248916 RepID=UPI00031574A5|nr:PEP-CTERM domain protein [Sandarakinorhabdus sp. AAP62]